MKNTIARLNLFLLALLFWSVPWITAAKTDPLSTPCLTSRNLCMECHKEVQAEEIFKETRGVHRPCDQACAKCHKKLKGHHKTGMEVNFEVSAEIRLTKERRLVCVTCHDLSVKRFSATARKAQSLFQRMFKGKKKHKSYYLVMDNRNGQLCKQCH